MHITYKLIIESLKNYNYNLAHIAWEQYHHIGVFIFCKGEFITLGQMLE